MDKNKNRRQFLRNTSLTALSLGLIPVMGQCKTQKKVTKDPALTCDPTTLDYYGTGPFYTANPPSLSDNKLASNDEVGTRMIISGRVFNLDCNQAIPNAIIDVWQANDAGAYDNEGYNLRGQVLSNEQGFYMFETIQPGKYLNGASYRPSHIHFKITPPGFSELTTQLYFEGDTDIPGDAAASITSGNFDASHRIISLTTNNEGVLEGTWDIVINGEGINVSTQNLHLDKGIVYGVNPNPFTDSLAIKYGVFKKSKISLLAFDMNGKQVATLEERELQPEKYEATWNTEANLPNGHYFIVLKVNDLQVHYLKVLKQG